MNGSLDASVAVRDGFGAVQTATVVGAVGPYVTTAAICHAWREAIWRATTPAFPPLYQVEGLWLAGEIGGVEISVAATLFGPKLAFDEVLWSLDCRARDPRNEQWRERLSQSVYVNEDQSTLREIARAVAEWFAPLDERLDELAEMAAPDVLEAAC